MVLIKYTRIHTETHTAVQYCMHCNPCIESRVNGVGFGLVLYMSLVLSHTQTHTHTAGIPASLSGSCWDVRWSQWHYQSSAKPRGSMCDLCCNSSINNGPVLRMVPLPIHILGCLATMGLPKRGGLLWWDYTSVHLTAFCSFSVSVIFQKLFFSLADFLVLLSAALIRTITLFHC